MLDVSDIQSAVVQHLNTRAARGVVWLHIPNGGLSTFPSPLSRNGWVWSLSGSALIEIACKPNRRPSPFNAAPHTVKSLASTCQALGAHSTPMSAFGRFC
jgi:hypothetical protein